MSESRNTSFDQMGRLLTSEQLASAEQLAGTQAPYSFLYAYNLSGALIEETYPSGRVVKNTLNADGELSQVESRRASGTFHNYANGFTYNSAGAVTSMRLGNGRWENASYNERLQITQIGLGNSATDASVLKLEFKYNTIGQTDNNGSMREQKITVPTVGSNAGFTATQAYAYDSLNRIQSATETIAGNQTWKQTFQYDRYGNRRFDPNPANTTTIGSCNASICNPEINTSDNRLKKDQVGGSSVDYDYDANGALIKDFNGQRFSYDAESHQKEFFSASNQTTTPDATYHYDGEGKRVKKIVGTEVTIFVYDASGQLAAEYSNTVAPTTQATVSYLTTDHLGSPRIITDQYGRVSSRKDFTAFGEEVASSQRVGGPSGNGYDPPNVRQDYTGYQKDNESGLEFAQARYYNTGHGRFTSVDPLTASATIRNPQTFNRYSYVLNSPYKFTDPLGLIAGRPNPDSGIVLVGGDDWFTSCYCGATPQFTNSTSQQEKKRRPQGRTNNSRTRRNSKKTETPPQTVKKEDPKPASATVSDVQTGPQTAPADGGYKTGSMTLLLLEVKGDDGKPFQGTVSETVVTTVNDAPATTITAPTRTLTDGKLNDIVAAPGLATSSTEPTPAQVTQISAPMETKETRVRQTATYTITSPDGKATLTVVHTRVLRNIDSRGDLLPEVNGTRFRYTPVSTVVLPNSP